MCLNPIYVKGQHFPCRKCIECLIQYSTEWTHRIMLESKKYEHNCFITLTYNEDNLPDKASLSKRDLQLFFKSLRKRLSGCAIRYFACGEYGSERGRPHYHAIIFNWVPDDLVFFRFDGDIPLYRSKTLEKIWKKGFSSVGFLTEKSVKYCSKYIQLGQNYKTSDKIPPFTLMSRRPGIALDCIPNSVYQDLSIYRNGKKYLAPRSFMKKFKEEFPELYELMKYKKLSLGQKLYSAYDNDIEGFDNARERLLEENYNNLSSLEARRKKFQKIFGEMLDNQFRPVLTFKQIIKSRKSD